MILVLAMSPGGDLPSDVLALIEPEAGLALLGENPVEANLARLIDARARTLKPADGKLPKELESAIQNLASSSEKVRKSSRKKLVDAGLTVKKRLEEVATNDARRAAEAKKVLQALADAKSTGVHEKDIARIFAIRLAAKNKISALIPNIQKAANSKSSFVSFAAKDALARFEKKADGSTKTVVAGSGIDLRDVRALPSNANALLALSLRAPIAGVESGVTIGSFFTSMTAQLPPGAAPDMEGELKEARTELLDFVKSYGNMRPERVVISNYGDVGPTGAGLGIVVHGRYEPAILRASLAKNEILWKTTEVEGSTIYNSAFLRLVLLSDSSVLILPIMASNKFPLAKFLKNYNAKTDSISKSERLALFVKTLEQPFYARAIALTREKLMKQMWAELEDAPENVATSVKGMQELELTLTQDDEGKATIRLEGVFDSKDNAKVLSDVVKDGVKEGIAQLEQTAAQIDLPMIKTMLDAMKTIKVTAEGKRGIFRMNVPAMGLKELMSTMFMGIAGSTERQLAE
jgi:hypothetical protein